jgi:hypothetical protein
MRNCLRCSHHTLPGADVNVATRSGRRTASLACQHGPVVAYPAPNTPSQMRIGEMSRTEAPVRHTAYPDKYAADSITSAASSAS